MTLYELRAHPNHEVYMKYTSCSLLLTSLLNEIIKCLTIFDPT